MSEKVLVDREQLERAASVVAWMSCRSDIKAADMKRLEQCASELSCALAAPPAQPDAALVEALEHARQFIRNGIDLGFIRMPDGDTPDPAHETLTKIEAALSIYRAALAGKGGE